MSEVTEERRTALGERVSAIVKEEATEPEGHTAWHRLTDIPGRPVSEPEALSRLWGYVYGVTLGMVRSDFADLSDAEAALLAFEVASDQLRAGSLVDLELIRLLETGRIDEEQMSSATLEAIDEVLSQMEAAS